MASFYDSIRGTGFRRGPQRIAGGVCGGIAYRFQTNVTLVRLLTLLAFLLPGIGLGLYLVAWLLLPWQDGSIPLEQVFSGDQPR